MIVIIKPKIKVLFAENDKAAEGVESLYKKPILRSIFMSLVEFLEKPLHYRVFANSSDKDTKMGTLMGLEAT